MASTKQEQTDQFAHETITYTTEATAKQPAASVTLDLIYRTKQTAEEAKHGYYHVSGVSGTYTELNANGKATASYPVTGIVPARQYETNNNSIYLEKTGGAAAIVDKHGLGFYVSTPRKGHPDLMTRIDLTHTGTSASKGYVQDARLDGSGKSDKSAVASLKATAAKSTAVKSTAATAAPRKASADAPAAACFAAGTRILTAQGEVAVEALAVGDLVVTTKGATRPIRWLGHRTIEAHRYPRPLEIMPVRIAAHALGPQRPARDLRVSPGHALCLDVLGEVLVPAAALVDGTSVVQETVERVTYWHVELDSHDVLLAENLPAESYLEMSNRAFFVESGLVGLAVAPDAPAGTHVDFCRPYVDNGPLIEAARGRIAARAAATAASGAARVA